LQAANARPRGEGARGPQIPRHRRPCARRPRV